MYTLIGNGRLARHLIFYFDQLGVPFNHWHRRSEISLQSCLKKSSHVLLLITDHQIDPFIVNHFDLLRNHQLVHCSGAHLSSFAHTAHVPVTFGESLYTIEEYKKFPFVLEKEGPLFSNLLPGLPNPHYYIPRTSKAYYHALCVMANNFTTLLWQKLFSECKAQFNIPEGAMHALLKGTFDNLQHNSHHALTGPLVRQDHETIDKNLSALKEDPFYEVYQSFVNAYLRSHSHESTPLFAEKTS
jgi:2-dehydropantoate 2-reductase